MPHSQVGHLNYLSNSNLDYNNPLNVRRVGAFAGVHHMGAHQMGMHHMGRLHLGAHAHMHGTHSHSHLHGHHPHHHSHGSLAGLAYNEMGGIVETVQEQVMDKPFLIAGLSLIAYPSIASNTKKLKTPSKKTKKQFLYAGLGSIAFHYLKPMLMGE